MGGGWLAHNSLLGLCGSNQLKVRPFAPIYRPVLISSRQYWLYFMSTEFSSTVGGIVHCTSDDFRHSDPFNDWSFSKYFNYMNPHSPIDSR